MLSATGELLRDLFVKSSPDFHQRATNAFSYSYYNHVREEEYETSYQ